RSEVDDKGLLFALLIEMREFAQRSLKIHRLAVEVAEGGAPIRAPKLTGISHFPTPIVFPKTYSRLHLIGEASADLLPVFQHIEALKRAVEIIELHARAGKIPKIAALQVAALAAQICDWLANILTVLAKKTGVTESEDQSVISQLRRVKSKWDETARQRTE